MTRQMTIGSLFSGYGGLDMAVEGVFNARTAWQAEWEDAPSKVLARHWPDVPNYRDVTAVDWSAVEPVDIITGGFPCQDVSLAGRRAGMTEGTRSNLWGAMRSAVEIIRPTYVVAENVRGLLSAKAESDSDMEPRERLLGDRSGGHLRALGRVLGDLADIGYDAKWCGLRASDVGAPHQRFRVFILATRRDAPHSHGLRGHWPRAPRLEVRRGEPADGRVGALDTAGDGRDQGRTEPAGQLRGHDAPQRSAPTSTDAGGPAVREHAGGSPAQEAGAGSGDGPGDHRGERPTGERGQTPANATCLGPGHIIERGRAGLPAPTGPGGTGGPITDWGTYAPAIHRWERLRGPAPAPTELTDRGKHRLSPAFTEWMMGLPGGWITDTPGIKRNDALKMCGNGVVPQQAVAALRHMLTTHDTEATA